MIDIHSHILYGIDDGAKTIEDSIDIIRQAAANGVTDIIVTPHFILGSTYNCNNINKKSLITKIKNKLKKENIDVSIYLGNEVFVEQDMLKLKKDGLIATLCNGKYLLFELPMNGEITGLSDIIFNLRCKGYIPVIAHPERYLNIKKNPKIVEDLLAKGALFQSNIGSFLGVYGKTAQKTAILLLKHHAITFIGSDIHHAKDNFYNSLEEVKRILLKYVSNEEVEDLLVNNASKILNKEVIETVSIKPIKKGLFGFK